MLKPKKSEISISKYVESSRWLKRDNLVNYLLIQNGICL